MKTLADILAAKGREVHVVADTSSVLEAVRAMRQNRIGSLLVVSGAEVVGILTERDILRQVVLEQRDPAKTLVAEIADRQFARVSPEMEIEETMELMTQSRRRHLPVFDEKGLCGLVSIGDVVKHLLDERQYQVESLTDYITGKYPG